MNKNTVMLIVLDGFGIRKEKEFNAILNSHMKNYFELWNNNPHTKLNASGPLVGLPKGQMGSSEVGHLTLGSGRLIKQPIVRINEDIENKKIFKNKVLIDGLEKVSKSKANIHLMGLLGPGGVHSHRNHLYALLEFYDKNSKKISGKVFIHNFLDGRDTPQKSAHLYLKHLENKIKKLKNKDKFVISTLCGRYYAMDRDKRKDRTKISAYMLLNSKGEKSDSWKKSIDKSYDEKVYDEFVKPVILDLEPLTSKDLVLCYNFRSDRPRQIIQMLLEKLPKLNITTLTEYYEEARIKVMYPNIYPKKTLGEILSNNNKTQLRISESEKYPHVTYFFNGLRFEPFSNEVQIKVLSPKVSTYDLKPEMSAQKVCDRVCKEIISKKYDFILLNFANSDMVGHTGNYKATIKALKQVDKNLLEIKNAIDKVNGSLLITADHGNSETMKDETGKPNTKHTYNLVPFILYSKNKYKLNQKSKENSLYNVAPTILELLDIKKPKEVSGKSLIVK